MTRSKSTLNVPSLLEYVVTHTRAEKNPPEDAECTICTCDIEPSSDGVTMWPCKHLFHRSCIRNWLNDQLIRSNRRSVTCPNCRVTFCTAAGLTERSITIGLEGFDILGERNPKFINITHEAVHRIRAAGEVTDEIVSWAIQEKAKIDPDMEKEYLGSIYRPKYQEHSFRDYVDVNTEVNQSVVDQMVRSDLMGLDVVLMQAIATEDNLANDMRRVPNWISAIGWAWNFWQECGYPRTNYIELASSHRLTICAGLIDHLSSIERFKNTSSFAQLLAHGDALLLQAQQDARRSSQPPQWYIEHNRLLSHADATSHPVPSDDIRRRYIAGLRIRTRGPGADPFGPPPGTGEEP